MVYKETVSRTLVCSACSISCIQNGRFLHRPV